MSHVGHVATGGDFVRLAEGSLVVELWPELETLSALPRKHEAERTLRAKGHMSQAVASAIRQAEQGATAAAEAIERVLEATLAPLNGKRAGLSLELAEQTLRLAIVSVLGFESAAAIRNGVALPLEPLLVCRGNPLVRGEDDRFDYLGGRGCRVVYRGQWRRSRHGRIGPDGEHELVALGPRCSDCTERFAER
jgi:hypothetical protein